MKKFLKIEKDQDLEMGLDKGEGGCGKGRGGQAGARLIKVRAWRKEGFSASVPRAMCLSS